MNSNVPLKTPEEIEIMRHGALILKEALEKMEEIAVAGVSTYEMDRIAEEVIRSYEGAVPGFKGYHGFPATLCTSINEEVVHGIPSEDAVLMEVDCGVLYGGFYTDACRTFCVGDVEPDVRHFVKTTKIALKNAIKEVREGAYMGTVSAAIQDTLEKQGYSPVVECTGHGVGTHLHEPPEILNVGQKNTGIILRAGMVLAIEPISIMSSSGRVLTAPDGWTVISYDNALSAHFEHTVLVTKNGSEILV